MPRHAGKRRRVEGGGDGALPTRGSGGRAGRPWARSGDGEEEGDGGHERAEGFEAAPRQRGWERTLAGRLPVKLADGRVAAPRRVDRGEGGKGVPAHRSALAAAAAAAAAAAGGEGAGDEESGDEDDEEEEEEGAGGATGEDGSDAEAVAPASTPGIPAVTSYVAWARLDAASRAARRDALRTSVAAMAERITADPERNVMQGKPGKERDAKRGGRGGRAGGSDSRGFRRSTNTLKQLHGLCLDADPEIRRLAMLSCVAVFSDIVPSYRIRLPTAAEKSVRVKKEVRRLWDFEAALLSGYQRFLRMCEAAARAGEAAGRRIATGKPRGPGAVGGGAGGDDGSDGASTARGGGGAFDVDALAGAGDDVVGEGDAGSTATGKRGSRLGDREYGALQMAKARAAKAMATVGAKYDADDGTVYGLGVIAVRCMATLLPALAHFNFRTNLVTFLIGRVHSRDAAIADPIVTAVERLLHDDTAGDASAELLAALSDDLRSAASRPGGWARVNPSAVAAVSRLKLSHLERSDREGKLHSGMQGRTARKLAAAADGDEVLAGLKAADAEALEERKRHGIAALKSVVTIFFRVLRAPGGAAAHLLPPVLAGLAKYAHLIDVGVVTDLIAALRELVVAATSSPTGAGERDEGAAELGRVKLSVEAVLHCVLTATRVVSAAAELLNADETAFALGLYRILPRLMDEPAAVPLAVTAINALLITRRDFAAARVRAFAHRCACIALHLPANGAMAMLACTRALIARYPAARSLLAPPAASPAAVSSAAGGVAASATAAADGGGDDPDHTPAHTAWPLVVLAGMQCAEAGHWHPAVKSFAAAGLRSAPPLPSEAPEVLWKAHDASTGAFNPAIRDPPTRPPPAPGQLRWVGHKRRRADDGGWVDEAEDDGGGAVDPVDVARGVRRHVTQRAAVGAARADRLLAAAKSAWAAHGGGDAVAAVGAGLGRR